MSFEIPSISLDYGKITLHSISCIYLFVELFVYGCVCIGVVDDCINSTVEIHNPPALPAVDLNSINELH